MIENKSFSGSVKILIVDDEPANLQVLSDTLNSAGYIIQPAINGKTALEVVEEELPDLILLDINMPGMNGFDVCEALKSDPKTNAIPVIFISAFNDVESKVEGFAKGGVDYITKPFQYEEVLARVRTHLQIRFLQAALEEANKKLEEMSLTDYLTKTHNRRFLNSTIIHDILKTGRDYQEMERNCVMAENTDIIFLMLDIDHFKAVNDTYGHEAGDRVLIQFAEILKRVCRNTDYIIRWGGEEFLVVSRFSNRKNGSQIAERIRSTVENYNFEIGDGQTIKKTCSIGIAAYPFLFTSHDKVRWEKIIEVADHGLYIAKKSGRNTHIYIESTDTLSDDSFHEDHLDDIPRLEEEGKLTINGQD